MGTEAVLVLVIILAITVFLLFAVRMAAKAADNKMHDSVVEQLNTYDSLIEEKQVRLSGVRAQIETLERQLEAMQPKDKSSIPVLLKPYLGKPVKFCRPDFQADYRNIKEHFSFDKKAVVRYLYQESRKLENPEEVFIVSGLIEKLPVSLIYQILQFTQEEQKEIVSCMLNEREETLFQAYLKECERFYCEEFVYWLRCRRLSYDSRMIVKTADAEDDYSDISEKIETVYDDKLCEGLLITCNRKLYDFGIHYNELC